MTRLENWAVQRTHVGQYASPHEPGAVLVGVCYDHPKHDDGTEVRTSYILSIDLAAMTAETRNREYRLGTPSFEYAERYL